MSNLHPVIAQALEPFAAPIAAKALEHFFVPRLAVGQIEYEWHADCQAPIICHLDYQPFSRGYCEPGGGQIDPDETEAMTLCAAYHRGDDIFGLLCEEQIEHIEELAMAHAGGMRFEDAYDEAESRAEDAACRQMEYDQDHQGGL